MLLSTYITHKISSFIGDISNTHNPLRIGTICEEKDNVEHYFNGCIEDVSNHKLFRNIRLHLSVDLIITLTISISYKTIYIDLSDTNIVNLMLHVYL